MTSQRMMVQADPDAAGHGTAGSEIQTFRLGDYGLIDVAGAPPSHRLLQHALLSEWSTSPAGVIIRLGTDQPPDDCTLGALTDDVAALVHAWPGTPIGLITASPQVRDVVASHPHGEHLAVGATLIDVWDGMWFRGGKWTFTIELPPTVLAASAARDIVARACADWDLNVLAASAALLTGDLVARSVLEGAHDIHFTVSRHQSRIRVLARDDVPPTADDEPKIIDQQIGVPFVTPDLTCLADSLGEFALDGHHVRWAVTHDLQAA
jgi:hypothetical protein